MYLPLLLFQELSRRKCLFFIESDLKKEQLLERMKINKERINHFMPFKFMRHQRFINTDVNFHLMIFIDKNTP